MKKTIRSAIPLFLLLAALAGNLVVTHASDIMPLYTGVASLTSGLTVSNTGKATCNGNVILWDDYTADVTVELKRDGITIKTWTASGSEVISAGGTYYVTSGHEYVVTTTATVYDSNGKIVESPSKDSPSKNY